jgi:hypothetical protein
VHDPGCPQLVALLPHASLQTLLTHNLGAGHGAHAPG